MASRDAARIAEELSKGILRAFQLDAQRKQQELQKKNQKLKEAQMGISVLGLGSANQRAAGMALFGQALGVDPKSPTLKTMSTMIERADARDAATIRFILKQMGQDPNAPGMKPLLSGDPEALAGFVEMVSKSKQGERRTSAAETAAESGQERAAAATSRAGTAAEVAGRVKLGPSQQVRELGTNRLLAKNPIAQRSLVDLGDKKGLKLDAEIAKIVGQDLKTFTANANTARDVATNAQIGVAALETGGVSTGAFGEGRLLISQFAKLAGADKLAERLIGATGPAAAELLRTAASKTVGTVLDRFKGSTSNRELDFSKKAVISLTTTPDGNILIGELFNRLAVREEKVVEIATKALVEGGSSAQVLQRTRKRVQEFRRTPVVDAEFRALINKTKSRGVKALGLAKRFAVKEGIAKAGQKLQFFRRGRQGDQDGLLYITPTGKIVFVADSEL